MSELKPCPFCGGKVTHYHTEYKTLFAKTFDFRCEKCNTLFFIPFNSKYECAKQTDIEAINAWNRRTNNATN